MPVFKTWEKFQFNELNFLYENIFVALDAKENVIVLNNQNVVYFAIKCNMLMFKWFYMIN